MAFTPDCSARAASSGAFLLASSQPSRIFSVTGRAVADVKQATSLPVIVNGDVIDLSTAREALTHSRADAVMIGRGAYGRPWIAALLDRALHTGETIVEPDCIERLEIILNHFQDNLRFYGDELGLKVFRNHLGWYVEKAPVLLAPEARRAAKSHLCRLNSPREVESGLTTLWLQSACS